VNERDTKLIQWLNEAPLLAAAPDAFGCKDAVTWQQPKRIAIEHRQVDS
jgi:hypothetical protein